MTTYDVHTSLGAWLGYVVARDEDDAETEAEARWPDEDLCLAPAESEDDGSRPEDFMSRWGE